MITIADINSRIRPQLPNVVLSPDLFGNDTVLTPLLQQYFSKQQGSVSIGNVLEEHYQFDSDKGVIIFSGTAVKGPFDGYAISAVTISVVDGHPQLCIDATGKDGWKLSTGFPELNSEVLKLMPLKAPALYWSSYDGNADEPGQGFYFEGSLNLDVAPLNLVKALLPGLNGPVIWGQINMMGSTKDDIFQYVPSMVLNMDVSQDAAKLGPLTISGPKLQFFAAPVFNVSDNNWQSDNFLRITSVVQFGDEQILLQADITDLSSPVMLQAQMDLPIGGAISEIETLLGIKGLEVPGFKYQSPNDINLKDITIGFNPRKGSVTYIGVEIGTSADEKWKLWGNNTLESLDIKFDIIPGSGDMPTQVSGAFSGIIDEWLELKAAFSGGSYSFYAGLAKPVKIKDAYALMTGSSSVDMPDLEIDELDVTFTIPPANTGSYEYGGGISIDGNWELFTQPFLFALKGLMFKVSHTRDGKNAFTANAILEIGDYSLAIEGDYTTDDGWTLSGNLDLLEEKQNLSQIGARIDSQFQTDKDKSAPQLPAFITSWVVKSLAADYNTKKNNFDFTIDIGNSAIPGLDMNFGIHLVHSDTAVTKEFDATATYNGKNVKVEFDIVITEETHTTPTPGRVVTFKGAYKAAAPPKLSDLLLALSQDLGMDVTIPKELQLDAEAKDFAVVLQQTDAKPVQLEIAGDFGLQIAGSDLDIRFVYTNKTAYDKAFTQPAMVGDKPAYVLGVALGGIINLGDLPFVGKLPGINKLAVDKLGFYYTNATVNTGQEVYFEVPQISTPGTLSPNTTPAALSKTGFSLTATFGTLNNTTPATINSWGTMPIPVITSPATATPSFAAKPAKPTSPITWIDINKTFGPFELKQVGLNYSNGEATIGLSAGLALGGFNLEVQGLSVSFPMALPGQSNAGKVSFDLQGVGMDIKEPGFELGGFFLKSEDPATKLVSFYGEVIAQVGTFGLKAIGGYSPGATPPSFFIYAKVDIPLGGPPFLFVSGFAGGFGINSSLVLPTIDELPYCPLLPNKAPDPAGSGSDAIQRVLPALQSLFRPEPGEYWVAAGIQFSSFEMINAFVLATVSFGVDLRIGLIGSASMTFPTGAPDPVAYVEIDIMATYNSATGLIAVDGRLSPASFIYGGFVRLSGGFAFYTWVSGDHAGDFVVSVGGYHPAFNKPAHYPKVPRLGMAFGMGPFQVLGQAYFALTPGMMMAGLQLQATWHSGPIKAWLNAGVDFLIAWAPFHYEADAYISIGVSADLGLFSISVHVGADLYIWGPQFGGEAHVDLDVVAFTIKFGAPKELPGPVGWDTFKTSFLPGDKKAKKHAPPYALAAAAPAPTNIINAMVKDGLLQKDMAGYDWVLDADNFTILTNSTIPANFASLNPTAIDEANIPNDKTKYDPAKIGVPYLALGGMKIYDQNNQVWNTGLHIGPMGKDNIASYHYITIHKRNDKGQYSDPVNAFRLTPVLLNSTAALWAQQKADKSADDPGHVPFTLTGFSIQPIPRNPAVVKDVPLPSLLFQQGNHTTFQYNQQSADTRYTVKHTEDADHNLQIAVSGAAAPNLPLNKGYVLNTINDAWVQDQRNAILEDLAQHDLYTFSPSEVKLDKFAGKTQLTDWPVVELLGADPVL